MNDTAIQTIRIDQMLAMLDNEAAGFGPALPDDARSRFESLRQLLIGMRALGVDDFGCDPSRPLLDQIPQLVLRAKKIQELLGGGWRPEAAEEVGLGRTSDIETRDRLADEIVNLSTGGYIAPVDPNSFNTLDEMRARIAEGQSEKARRLLAATQGPAPRPHGPVFQDDDTARANPVNDDEADHSVLKAFMSATAVVGVDRALALTAHALRRKAILSSMLGVGSIEAAPAPEPEPATAWFRKKLRRHEKVKGLHLIYEDADSDD